MKTYLMFFVLMIAIVSCQDDDGAKACDVDNPVTDLPWLKDKVTELENSELSRKYFYVVQADYEGQTVFYVNSCCPMCLIVIQYYNCSGEIIESVDPDKVRNSTTIWTAEANECLF